jgi:hypothetical protein
MRRCALFLSVWSHGMLVGACLSARSAGVELSDAVRVSAFVVLLGMPFMWMISAYMSWSSREGLR